MKQTRYNVSDFKFYKIMSNFSLVTILSFVPCFKLEIWLAKDEINQQRDAQQPKRGCGQILQRLYFQNGKEFEADFFCVFNLNIDDHVV